MLKFFRRIRQKLINEGSLKRYLIYSIGEISLIMVGILLALQINNWNEERKNTLAEKVLLETLQGDIQFNIEAMEKSIGIHKEGLLATKEILRLFDSGSSEVTEFQLDTLISISKRPYTFNLKTGTINSIISSGEITLVRYDSIKKFITSFDGLKEDAEEGYLQLIESWRINLTPRILKYKKWASTELAKEEMREGGLLIRSEKSSSDIEGFFNDSEIMNLYYEYFYIIKTSIEQEKDLLSQLKGISEVISKELLK